MTDSAVLTPLVCKGTHALWIQWFARPPWSVVFFVGTSFPSGRTLLPAVTGETGAGIAYTLTAAAEL